MRIVHELLTKPSKVVPVRRVNDCCVELPLLGWRRYSASMNYIWIQGCFHVMWTEVPVATNRKNKSPPLANLANWAKTIAHPNTT